MSTIKAIFFDIDGTLVAHGHHQPPPEVIEAIDAVRRDGVKVFIATGRHIAWVDNLGPLRVDGFVTANGSIVLESDRETVIYKHLIPSDDVDRLIEFAHHSPLPVVAVPANGEIFLNKENDYVVKTRELLRIPPIPIRDLDSVGGRDIVRLMVFGSEKERERSGLFSDVLLNCVPTSWNPWFCDVIPRGSDKSVGIDRMLEHHGIPLGEAMAFGDGGNDIGMLRHVAVGVAMGNSEQAVKAAADFVTTDVLDHGVVNALRHFGLVRELPINQ